MALRAQAYPKCRVNSSNGLQMGLEKFAEQISSLNCLPLGQSAALASYRPKATELALLGPPGGPPHLHPTCCSDSGPGCRGWDVRSHVRVTVCSLAQVLYSPRSSHHTAPKECCCPSQAIFGCRALESFLRLVLSLGPRPGLLH